MDGFDAGEKVLPTPLVDVGEQTKGRLALVLMAVVHGCTPEEVAGFIDNGFPAEVERTLERPFEREEMAAHVDLLLTVLQSPVEAAA
jgi:hypothetical protein